MEWVGDSKKMLTFRIICLHLFSAAGICQEGFQYCFLMNLVPALKNDGTLLIGLCAFFSGTAITLNSFQWNPHIPWPEWFPFIFVSFMIVIAAVFRSKERSRRLEIEHHIKDFSDSQSLESYVCGLDPKVRTEPLAVLGIFGAVLCILALITAAKVPRQSTDSSLTSNVSPIPTVITASFSSTNDLPHLVTSAEMKVSPGVEDIVRLSQAHLSDGVILNYTTNSTWSTKLTADDLLYMKNKGVSESVLSTLRQLVQTK